MTIDRPFTIYVYDPLTKRFLTEQINFESTQKSTTAGRRTRVACIESDCLNHYTTPAWMKVQLHSGVLNESVYKAFTKCLQSVY